MDWLGYGLHFPCLASWCRWEMSSCTTDGSARVEMSPSSSVWSAATLRKILLMILPERVFGRPAQIFVKDNQSICNQSVVVILMFYLDDIGQGIGSYLLLDDGSQFGLRVAIGADAILQDDVSVHAFTFDVVRIADDSRLCHGRVLALKRTNGKRVKRESRSVQRPKSKSKVLPERLRLRPCRVGDH